MIEYIKNWFQKHIERNRNIKELLSMTDRELADIGIRRSDIGLIVDGLYKSDR